MKITPIREIENNTYKVTLKPESFGTATTTSEAEIDMLKDYPQTLRYADVDFAAKFVVTDGVPTISTDALAVEVKIENLTNKEFLIGENLLIEFIVDANKIPASETDETVLTTNLLVGQAKAILFETKILAKIKELMDSARANVNDFEITTEQIL